MQACCKLAGWIARPILRLTREMFCTTEQPPSDEPRLQATVVEQGAEVEEGLANV